MNIPDTLNKAAIFAAGLIMGAALFALWEDPGSQARQSSLEQRATALERRFDANKQRIEALQQELERAK